MIADSGHNQGIEAREVQSRRDLSRYLDQTLVGDYVSVIGEDEIAQTSNYVKSYLIEGHAESEEAFISRLKKVFYSVIPLREADLYLAYDQFDNPFFADAYDNRFLIFHSIAKTASTDKLIERLTDSAIGGFDRSWMPTQFLRKMTRGDMTGFRFGYEQFVQGISHPKPQLPHMGSVSENVRAARFRMSVSEDVTAATSYSAIQQSELFVGKKALEHIQFLSTSSSGQTEHQPQYVNNRIYADGKIIGYGTSIGAHLLTVDRARTAYRDVLQNIEVHAIGWIESDRGFVLGGEPFILSFPEDLEISDLRAVASSIMRPAKPFRLMGIPHRVSERRIDIEAIDLHTGDPFSIELTHEWMRIFLPQHTCGNIVARLYTNLLKYMHSDIQIVTGSGEVLFSEESSN